jgi:hypothetical protein
MLREDFLVGRRRRQAERFADQCAIHLVTPLLRWCSAWGNRAGGDARARESPLRRTPQLAPPALAIASGRQRRPQTAASCSRSRSKAAACSLIVQVELVEHGGAVDGGDVHRRNLEAPSAPRTPIRRSRRRLHQRPAPTLRPDRRAVDRAGDLPLAPRADREAVDRPVLEAGEGPVGDHLGGA